jgi:hypothetical protein
MGRVRSARRDWRAAERTIQSLLAARLPLPLGQYLRESIAKPGREAVSQKTVKLVPGIRPECGDPRQKGGRAAHRLARSVAAASKPGLHREKTVV